MEQHAVPQDITGFKFKLVGDMTLKQFGELAVGAILAYLFYASSWNPLIKWPLVILCGLLGVALAFLPIEERPLDLWIVNFFRAIYRPTLYVWRKGSSGTISLEPDDLTTTKPPMKPIVATPSETEGSTLELAQWPFPKEEPDKKSEAAGSLVEPEITETPDEKSTLATASNQNEPTDDPASVPTGPNVAIGTPTPAPVSNGTQPPVLSVEELQQLREQKLTELEAAKKQLQEVSRAAKEEVFKSQVVPNVMTVEQLSRLREEKNVQKDQEVKSQLGVGEGQLNELITQNKNLVSQIDGVKNQIGLLSGVDATELTKKLDTLLAQKDDLSKKIAALSDDLAAQRAAPLINPAYQEPRTTATQVPGVRILNKPQEKNTTISLSDQPNVISGMIINEKGAPVDGVIVLIKDNVGNSIRALKTNGLGQFVVATPLENGTYYVEMEKPGYTFSVLEVSLSGQVLAPLEIPAKQSVVNSQ